MWQAMMWEPEHFTGGRRSVAAEQARLMRLRREVDERWRTLALAADRSSAMPTEALDRLYDAYMRAVDVYVAAQRALAGPREAQRRAS